MADDTHWMMEHATAMAAELVAWRRHLHMHPEPSMEEHETAAFVVERLREIGVEEIREGVGETGVVAMIRGQGDRAVGLRADMDALEMPEESDAEYASRVDGMMHACGHDGHTACLLGVASILHEMGDSLPGAVKLIFQPGEEGAAGARRMIQDGCLEDPEIEAIVAQHVQPDIASGTVGLTRGFVTAQSDSIDLTFIGETAHAARPHQGTDAISLASQALSAIQQFLARSTNPLDRKVVTFGTIEGGTRRNVLADRVSVSGTLRTYEEETREAVIDFIGNRLRSMVSALNGRLEVSISEGYPPLWNEDWVLDRAGEAAREVVGDDRVEEVKYPSMGAEDFAFFQHDGHVPAAMLRLGTRDEQKGFIWPVHNTRFDFDDEVVLPAGAAVLANTAVKLLER